MPESVRTMPLWVGPVGVAWEYEENGELKKEKKVKMARKYCVGVGTEEAKPCGGMTPALPKRPILPPRA
jgi:hypothetical protein